jgi:hypothetical protein
MIKAKVKLNVREYSTVVGGRWPKILSSINIPQGLIRLELSFPSSYIFLQVRRIGLTAFLSYVSCPAVSCPALSYPILHLRVVCSHLSCRHMNRGPVDIWGV